MPRRDGRALLLFLCAVSASAQTALTWDQVRERFRANNPNLAAAKAAIEEARAQEITAFLRPNPTVTTVLDQLTPFSAGPYQPLTFNSTAVSGAYLHERQRKPELRQASAPDATDVVSSVSEAQDRVLFVPLPGAYV